MRREVNCLWRYRNYSVRTCATSARQSIRAYWKGNRIYSVLRHDRKKTLFAVHTVYLKASFGRNEHLQSMWSIFELAWQTPEKYKVRPCPLVVLPLSTDYGHMMSEIPNSLWPKFKSQSQKNIWVLDIKA